MSNVVNLPEEIIVDILSRLPVKSLCQFRCVSNSWRTLISDPYFIRTHVNRKSKYGSVCFLPSGNYLGSVGHFEQSDNDSLIAKKFDYPSIGSVDILGSCNGLLLVVNKEKTKILLNPSTREFMKLPKSPSDLISTSVSDYMYGLGYDSSSDDYKVVEVWFPDLFRDGCGCTDRVASVYSLKTSSWRRIKEVPTDRSHHWCSSGVFVDWSMRWLIRRLSAVNASFDLAVKKFIEDPAPSSLNCKKLLLSLIFGGCLFMLEYPRSTSTDVWVKKEYWAYWLSESWKKFTICMPNSSVMIPLSLLVDGEVLFQAKHPYVQSLISPHYSNEIEKKYKRGEKRKKLSTKSVQ